MNDTGQHAIVSDLGRGYGSHESLAYLRTTQLTKRVLFLRTLVSEAAKQHPEPAARAGLTDALSRLAVRRRSHADVVNELLLYPATGTWIRHAFRRISERPDEEPNGQPPLWADLAYLGWLTAAADNRTTTEGSAKVIMRAGAVMLPGLGLAQFGPPDQHGAAVLRWHAASRQIELDGIAADLSDELPDTATGHWLPMRHLGDTELNVLLDDIDPFRPTAGIPADTMPPGRLTGADLTIWRRTFQAAEAELSQGLQAYAEPMRTDLRTIVPLSAQPVVPGASATDMDAYGAVATTAPGNGRELALTLIHEFQHGKLGALTDIVQLHADDRTARYYAPWRDDPRPLAGLLQGIYAHLGVTDFWRVMRTRPDGDHLLADVEFTRSYGQVTEAIQVVQASGLLTDAGDAFVAGMSQTLAGWTDNNVPSQVQLLAEEGATFHRVAWRVRNLAPAVDELDLLFQAWADGAPAPRQLPPSRLVDQRTVPAHYRIRLSPSYANFLATQGGPNTDGLSPQAEAFIRSDYARAVDICLRERDDDPMCPQTWATLVLAARRTLEAQAVDVLIQRPELIAHLAADVRKPVGRYEVLDLARWLASATGPAVGHLAPTG